MVPPPPMAHNVHNQSSCGPSPPQDMAPMGIQQHGQHVVQAPGSTFHHQPVAHMPAPAHVSPPPMKPAPVMITVVDGQGNEAFMQHNPQHMDQAMQYLLQQQLNLYEPQPLTNNNDDTAPTAVSPIPLQQHDAPVPQQQQQHHQHDHSNGYHYTSQGQVHDHHQHHYHQQQYQQPAHSFEDGHHYAEAAAHAHIQQGQYHHPTHVSNTNHNSNVGDDNNSNMNLWQQVQTHKQQDSRMMEIRQLMTLNMQRQQNKKHSVKNNYRASAA
jgi:hypothetical protein